MVHTVCNCTTVGSSVGRTAAELFDSGGLSAMVYRVDDHDCLATVALGCVMDCTLVGINYSTCNCKV